MERVREAANAPPRRIEVWLTIIFGVIPFFMLYGNFQMSLRDSSRDQDVRVTRLEKRAEQFDTRMERFDGELRERDRAMQQSNTALAEKLSAMDKSMSLIQQDSAWMKSWIKGSQGGH